jgi:methyl-accepting chemotaxis protein
VSGREAAAGALVQAAGALEEQLRQLEALAAEAQRLPLTSRKNVEKTTAKLQELGGFEERLGTRLRAVVEAVAALGEHQRAVLEALAARADELQRRRADLGTLLEEYQALGARAQELSAAAKEVAALPEASGARAALADVRVRVEELVGAAERVTRNADEQQFDDVSREADSLRQTLLAIRNRLGLLARS